MARPKRKGEAGASRNYITRNQAVRKLQLSLPDFRKLCIWKGIYPREPRSKKKVSKSSTASTTFYYAKDIQYLLHEPLVNRFREQKALEKKISRALGRGDVTDAKRYERNAARPEKTGRPRYTLDHVIRERYPTFVDSLRDLDDCLSMLFLFANLPSTSSVPAKMVARCERLCLEFQHYLIVSHSLRKSFLSIKGVYFQADVQGETLTWLVPYKFNQRVVGDIDFRIMGTFVEFYMTLLGFVNFRLYTAVGLKYPPKFDQAKDDSAGELGAFTLEDVNAAEGQGKTIDRETERGPDPLVQAEVNKLVQELRDEEAGKSVVEATTSDDAEDVPSNAIDKFEPAAQGGDVLPQPSFSASHPRQLFSKCTIYLSRETPRGSIEFLLRAFGCKRVGWDAVLGEGAYTTDEMNPNITHQIVDRPPAQVKVDEESKGGDGEDNQTAQKLAANRRVAGRIYVQPQWVWDSVNAEELQQPDLYAPGAQLPPHLSPFVKSVQGQYDPSLPLDQQQTDMEALESDVDEDEDEDEDEDDAEEEKAVAKAVLKVKEAKKAKEAKTKAITREANEDSDGGMDVADTDEDEDEDEDSDEEPTVRPDVVVDALEEEDEDEEEADSALQRQLELEAELSGKPLRSTGKAPLDPRSKAKAHARKALANDAKKKADELERAKGMLPKKKRRLYEQMVYTNTKRSAEDEKLRAKRRKLERKQTKSGASKA
ncbi:mRNA-binding ribosome synthesis protein nop7 [Sporothrix epigloea]|uniref:Pescadillo homolog n=1 Tax=Sporothrix epigloea TaxID=1892477 RepID=A0ABP0DP09_9PEZI